MNNLFVFSDDLSLHHREAAALRALCRFLSKWLRQEDACFQAFDLRGAFQGSPERVMPSGLQCPTTIVLKIEGALLFTPHLSSA